MKKFFATFLGIQRVKFFAFLSIFAAGITFGASSVYANHSVLVEGNCNFAPYGHQNGPVPAGTCGDYDGDGRIGLQEDNDGDRVFGTLNGANSMLATAASNNGTITIVASGTFAESVTITGNITLQAAFGVEANIDAVLQGDPGTTTRQSHQFGIIVNAPANRYVVIRNISVRNWVTGIHIDGNSRVLIDNCRFEHNVNYGIEVNEGSRVVVTNSVVVGTGFRLNPVTGDFPTTSTPNPGHGISFSGASSGIVSFTSVSGSFGAGINKTSSGMVQTFSNTIFDNGIASFQTSP
jgi:hypothetical protein